MSKLKVIIIGAGAAGLMAAGRAAEEGAEVVVLEKMSQPGRKLRITGKGRCNLTNVATIQEFIAHFGTGGKFLRQAFARFSNKDLIGFFNNLGLPTVTERGGRVFPESGEANDVVQALVAWTYGLGVKITSKSAVSRLLIENKRIKGVTVLKNPENDFSAKVAEEKSYYGDSVIIATGGRSYPATGSTGDGYRLAESAGHTVTDVRPALVPLITAGNTASGLEGLSLKNITASLWINGKKTDQEFGDMLFTGNGLSGPVILTLSSHCVNALRRKENVIISIDLKPALEHNTLDQRLLRDIKNNPGKTVKNMLKGLLPERLIQVCLEGTKISPEKTSNQVSADERKRLRVWLKDFRLEVTGYGDFSEAIITAGGISTDEVDPRTLESRLVKGLFFAGEVLDVDADTGGYNLQAAFSTGWLAGRAAVEFKNENQY